MTEPEWKITIDTPTEYRIELCFNTEEKLILAAEKLALVLRETWSVSHASDEIFLAVMERSYKASRTGS